MISSVVTFYAFCLLLLPFITNGDTDLSIYGAIGKYDARLFDLNAVRQIYSKCFWGFGFLSCQALNLNWDYQNDLSYYQNFNQLYGLNYCLECCGSARTTDIWQLGCAVDKYTRTSTNIYGYDFIFAANDYAGSNNIIRCPLKRKACVYNSTTGDLKYCSIPDNKHLHGYTLTLDVILNHNGLSFWNTIKKCSAVTIESNDTLQIGDKFYETIIMNYGRNPQSYDSFQYSLLSLLAIGLVLLLLGYLRRAYCVVCNKKLVVCFQRCYICRFYGAEPPDPLLLKALEEKALALKGIYPERVPGETFIRSRFISPRLYENTGVLPAARIIPISPAAPSASPTIEVLEEHNPEPENELSPASRGGEEIDQRKKEKKQKKTAAKATASSVPIIKTKHEKEIEILVKNRPKNRYTLDVHPHVLFSAVHHPRPPPPFVDPEKQIRDMMSEVSDDKSSNNDSNQYNKSNVDDSIISSNNPLPIRNSKDGSPTPKKSNFRDSKIRK